MDLLKKTIEVKIVRTNIIHEGNTHQNYFFPRLKPLMLSSKISHTAAFVLQHILPLSSVAFGRFDDADDVDATVDRDWPNEDLDATPVRLGDADGVETNVEVEAADDTVAGSTSTTRNTALPSSILRTLSASQSPRDDDEDEDGDPIKASQTALPNLRKSVWLAMAANIACCCSFWDDDSEEDELEEEEDGEMLALGGSKGEVGGVGYADVE